MKLLKKDFHQMVLDEANHLRKHATDEEKSKLDFKILSVNSGERCIYGQMTGSCVSDRACELFQKTFRMIGSECQEIERKGCTTYTEWLIEEDNYYKLDFSPIEVYITLKGSKNKQLIQYIKGEINTFKP